MLSMSCPSSALVVQSNSSGKSKFTGDPSVDTLIGKVPSSPICIISPEADLHLIVEGFLFSITSRYLFGTSNPAVFPVSTTISPVNGFAPPPASL